MKKKICIIVAIILILIIAVPYIKVEFLTMYASEQFERSSFEMVDNISYCKVMKYQSEYAEVLYVCKGKATILVKYEKISDEWKEKSWQCIWSATGTADEFIWPYYR